jgi:predicted nucleic acid-binding protein
MPRALLDTTYLLPAAGIAVEGVPPDAIRRVREAGYDIRVSDLSVFELLAKGAKLASQGKADPERVLLAIKSILSDSGIGKVGAYKESTMAAAVELRSHHADFVDCVILASAASECDAIVTEDSGITTNAGLKKVVLSRNPEFKFLNVKGLPDREP